ncbi:MAG: hypothetical protein HYU51_11300 [Candidatus Rokubacteria bacterium]|nr:hypothetical protein [Candidatus Rokubacteria bacterium]
MNPVERIVDGELAWMMDRLAASLPAGTLEGITASSPTLRARLEEAEAGLAQARAALLADYGRWRRALDDLENLWALASWRSALAQEAVEQTATLAA